MGSKRTSWLKGFGLVLLFSLSLFSPPSAQAGYYSILHDTSNTGTSSGSAIVVAMPAADNGRVQVTRIRISVTATSSLDFVLRSARETHSLGGTNTLSSWTCSLPGCQDVYAVDGVKAGRIYDMDGLELNLSPGHRLFLYTNSDIGSDYFTVEVWWRDL